VKVDLWKLFYSNGFKFQELTYAQGKLQGSSQAWYEHGAKWFNISYNAGRLNGTNTYWDMDGNITYRAKYSNGKLVKVMQKGSGLDKF
jgi:antitoxin component YwqK of YwqJK toxin-antitoxin module